MKAVGSKNLPEPQVDGRLPIKVIRQIEQELGIYLAIPRVRTIQSAIGRAIFGVYDEDEIFVGDIMADGVAFSESELRREIKKIFRILENPKKRLRAFDQQLY